MFDVDRFTKIYKDMDKTVSKKEALYILSKDEINHNDFLKLLFCNDYDVLEIAAKKARDLTEKYFGKNIFLYVPLYISNICSSGCVYCGFSALNKIDRRRLSLDEIEREFIVLKKKGFNCILLLTGEENNEVAFNYLKDAVWLAKKYFGEVLIETSPWDYEGYYGLVEYGLVGITLYQETYDIATYNMVHKFGIKKDFKRRLLAVEDAARAGVKEINIGCLLGLSKDVYKDVFLTAMHLKYLYNKFPNIEYSISFPRIRSFEGCGFKYTEVCDFDFVKFIVFSRLFLKNVGINISTREGANLRDNLIGLGVTKMSAESKTTVGGYSELKNTSRQFDICDDRSLDEVVLSIRKKGYNPEFINWV